MDPWYTQVQQPMVGDPFQGQQGYPTGGQVRYAPVGVGSHQHLQNASIYSQSIGYSAPSQQHMQSQQYLSGGSSYHVPSNAFQIVQPQYPPVPSTIENASTQQLSAAQIAEAAAQNQSMPSLNNLFKTQLCKHYQQTKHCHVGNKCHFAHGENELRKKEDTLPVEVQMKMLNIPYNNFKTQKCKYFYESDTPGQCKFGKNCSYAHGEEDMRNPYKNVDLKELVRDHYGVDGYDPTTPVVAGIPGGSIEVVEQSSNAISTRGEPRYVPKQQEYTNSQQLQQVQKGGYPGAPPTLSRGASLPSQSLHYHNGNPSQQQIYVPKYPQPAPMNGMSSSALSQQQSQQQQQTYPLYIRKSNSGPSSQVQPSQNQGDHVNFSSGTHQSNGQHPSYMNHNHSSHQQQQMPQQQMMQYQMNVQQPQNIQQMQTNKMSQNNVGQNSNHHSLFMNQPDLSLFSQDQSAFGWSQKPGSGFPVGGNGFNYMLINPSDSYQFEDQSHEATMSQ